ncbi:MAG: hypothetical protein U0W24_14400 [Bacteroidales bacterium]
MKTTMLLVFVLFFMAINIHAQTNSQVPPKYDKASFGLGIGMDYGGFGASFILYPQKNFGLFAAGGYNFVGFGYNAGFKARIVSDKKFTRAAFYMTGMYGYNAVIKVENSENLNKIFYGPTLGLGIDFNPGQESKWYTNIGLLVPIRSSEVDEYMENLENNYGVEFKNDLPPIGISLGFRFIIR